MALSLFQRDVCRLLARNRVASGESYLAGGATLNELLAAPRLSRDLDVFHDTGEALAASWQADRSLLETGGYVVRVARDRPGLVEAEVRRVRRADGTSSCRPRARSSRFCPPRKWVARFSTRADVSFGATAPPSGRRSCGVR